MEKESGRFKHTVVMKQEHLDLLENSCTTSTKNGRAIYMLQEVMFDSTISTAHILCNL